MNGTRPNPLGEAASHTGAAWSIVSGIVGALVGYGALTVTQATAIAPAVTAVGTVVAGLMPVISGLVSAYRTASAGREHVTPMADPRANDGTPLIPAVGSKTLASRSG